MDLYLPKSVIAFTAFLGFVAGFVLLVLMIMWRSRRKGRFSPFTENMFRLPGHTLRKQISDLSDEFSSTYFIFIISAVAFIGSILFLRDSVRSTAVLCTVVILIGSIWKIVQQIGELQILKLGCEGEEYTGQELNLLMRKRAFVFHDIPYRYGNIDHIVIGNNLIFAIETKAVRKPKKTGSTASRESNVRFDGSVLTFPHFTTSEPIDQAKIHAKYLQKVIKNRTGVAFKVMPVVAIPGWFIDIDSSGQPDVLVINPERGKALRKWLGEVHDRSMRNRVVAYIASVAQSITPNSNRTDPNATEHFDFWLNPKFKEKVLGEE